MTIWFTGMKKNWLMPEKSFMKMLTLMKSGKDVDNSQVTIFHIHYIMKQGQHAIYKYY